ncbi:hypothetical protein MMC22_000126 [Lobaria immixta]|nr:hypothetical protein [Lobaria immixta]
MFDSEDTANDFGDVVMVTKEMDIELFASVSRWPRNLPIEVLLMVFMLLDKNHLKSLRCVGKFFERLISPLLFDTIHISPHSQNLEAFRQITEHSDLCRYPRVLVYDVQRFKANIDPCEYYKELCHQLHSLRMDGSHSDIPQVDTEVEGFMRRARNCPDEYEGYSNCRVFRRGFESYRQKAEEEDHYNSSGQLLALLCIGLSKLPSLDTVNFKSRWVNWHLRSVDMSQSLRGLRIFSSPLARAWSPFHLKPNASSNQANTVHEFDNVISAFSLTKRRLKVLKSGCLNTVPYEKLYTKPPLSRTFREHSLAAMYSLKRLTLRIDRKHYSVEEGLSDPGNVFPEEKTLSVDLLAAALLRTPGLIHLSLTGEIRRDGDGLISISELFQTV